MRQCIYFPRRYKIKSPQQKSRYKSECRDFLGGPVVKNPPSSAGDAGSIPGQGTKIPYATGQLSSRTTSTELTRLQRENPRARVPACRKNCRAHELWSPGTTTRERKPKSHNQREARGPQRRPDAAGKKIKKINKF